MASKENDIEPDCDRSVFYTGNFQQPDHPDGRNNPVSAGTRGNFKCRHQRIDAVRNGSQDQNSLASSTRRDSQTGEETKSSVSTNYDSAISSMYTVSTPSSPPVTPSMPDSSYQESSTSRDLTSEGLEDSNHCTPSQKPDVLKERSSSNPSTVGPDSVDGGERYRTSLEYRTSDVETQVQNQHPPVTPSMPVSSYQESSTSRALTSQSLEDSNNWTSSQKPDVLKERSSSNPRTVGPDSVDGGDRYRTVSEYPTSDVETQIQNQHPSAGTSTGSFHSVSSHLQSFYQPSPHQEPTPVTNAPQTKLQELKVMVNVSSTRGEDSLLDFQETKQSEPENDSSPFKPQDTMQEGINQKRSHAEELESKTHNEIHPRTSVKRTRDSDFADELDSKNLNVLSENLSRLQVSSYNPKKKHQSKKRNDFELYKNLKDLLQGLPLQDFVEKYTYQDNDGDTLLMIAIIQEYFVHAQALIRLVPSADLLDVRNKLGQTALHLTVITHQRKLTRKLVLAGADLQSLDFIGNTPLHVACSNNDLDSVVSLTKLVTCIECPEKAERQKLIVPQPSEIYNYKGQTCLHIAAFRGYTALVKYLVETQFRADVNVPERLCGKTVLHIAAELGNKNLVKYLLSLDQTNRHALTYSRHSALDLALGRNRKTIVRLLQRAGIRTHHPDTDDEDDYASEDDSEEENWTPSDFQCSDMSRSYAPTSEPSEYDDLCVRGTLVRSFYNFS